MLYEGHIKNGVVVLDEPADLQEGARVRIEVTEAKKSSTPKSLAERMAAIIGKARDLPEDAAENHDRYLYGPTVK